MYFFQHNPQPRIHVGIMYGVGTSVEKKNEQGLVHLCEHLMLIKAKAALVQSLTDMGCNWNGYTTKDQVLFLLSCSTNVYGDICKFIMELSSSNLDIDKIDLANEIKVVEQEIALRKSGIDHLGTYMSLSVAPLLKGSKYAIKEHMSRMKDFTMNRVMQFWKKHFKTPYVMITAPRDILQKCKTLFGGQGIFINQHKQKRHINRLELRLAKTSVQQFYENNGNYFTLSMYVYPLGHRLRPIVDVIVYALFQSPWSIMSRILRFKYGVSYSIITRSSLFHDTGTLSIGFRVNAVSDYSTAVRLFLNCLGEFADASPKFSKGWEKYVKSYMEWIRGSMQDHPNLNTTFQLNNLVFGSEYGIDINNYINHIARMGYSYEDYCALLKGLLKARKTSIVLATSSQSKVYYKYAKNFISTMT